MKFSPLLWLCAAILFGLDQLSKWIVVKLLPFHSSTQIVPGFFDLVNIRNRGAAFGFLNRNDTDWQFWLFLAATILAILVILHLAKNAKNQPILNIGLGLVLGGALGNLSDRLRWRAVIDFLDFYIGSWHWPAFNIADMGICIGAGLICLASFRRKTRSIKQ